MSDDLPELTDKQQQFVDALPATNAELCDELDITESTLQDHRAAVQHAGVDLDKNDDDEWERVETPDSDEPDTPLWADEPVSDDDPDPSDLSERETYIVRNLQTGSFVNELAEGLDTRESVVHRHLRELRSRGWSVYRDDTSETVTIEGDHALRSSEHIGTRTRKANRWWELSHNELVREFKAVSIPDTRLTATSGHEDWVIHMTDLHAGDRERRGDGTVIYQTADIPAVIDHITERGIALADKHNANFDTCHLLWGGDFVTNEGIYEGQFEDLDSWLDEQHEVLHEPLIRQLKAASERFDSVNVVCQVGNHGDHRASGTSKQANADLILYKSIRNTVSHLQEHGDVLENVRFRIGEAKNFRNFPLRGGKLRGHLRHGQTRRPQAETSARKKEWLATLQDHDFDVAAMGHHHISGRIPWDGPPIICTGSPKPAGEFVERIGEKVSTSSQSLATCFGVSDSGVTALFPVDDRNYDG